MTANIGEPTHAGVEAVPLNEQIGPTAVDLRNQPVGMLPIGHVYQCSDPPMMASADRAHHI